MRDLFRGLSYIFGRAPGLGVPAVLIEGADGREKRDEDPGERCSADDREDVDSTEKRGGGCIVSVIHVSGKTKFGFMMSEKWLLSKSPSSTMATDWPPLRPVANKEAPAGPPADRFLDLG